jgi:hypothetical protein
MLHLQSDGVPTTARIEDQEVNNFNRMVFNVDAPAPQGRQKRPMKPRQ